MLNIDKGGVIKNEGDNTILSFECQKVTKTARKMCERGSTSRNRENKAQIKEYQKHQHETNLA